MEVMDQVLFEEVFLYETGSSYYKTEANRAVSNKTKQKYDENKKRTGHFYTNV